MATVPIYQPNQVREQALQGGFQQEVDVTRNARQLAQGLGQFGESVDRIVVRDAQDEAFKVEQQVRKDWANQRSALRDQYKGDNAEQYKAKADEWWSKARDTYGAQINPMARSIAGKSLEQYRAAAEADTVGYIQSEKTKAREINFRTLQDTIINQAGQTVTPENARVVSAATAATIEKNAIDYAAGEGLSSDVGKRMAREQLDKFHSETAISLADKDAAAARAYLNEFGKDIPLGLRTRIDAAVTKNYNDQEGKRISQSLAGLQTLAEKEEALAKIDNAELREAATTHVYRDQTRLTAVKTEATKALLGNAKLSYEKSGRVPPTLMVALEAADPGVAADLMRGIRADQKARRIEAQGETVKTDLKSYFELRDKVLAGEKVDPLAYRDKVSRSDLEEAKKLQEKMTNPVEQKKLFTEERTIDNYRPRDVKKDSEEWTNLRRTMEDTLITARTQKGKDLTDKEMRDALDPLFVSGEIERNWWPDTTKKRYQMTPEEVAKAKFPAPASADKFTTGQVYKDAKGNRAKYLGSGKWESVK